MSGKNRRILKSRLLNRRRNANIPLIVFVISLVLFCVVQLAINSILSPLGSKLEAFNSEKEYLIEENRSLEEELASSNSLTVIEHITAKKFKLDQTAKKQIVYVTDHSIRAEK
jgi:hypothetical protein